MFVDVVPLATVQLFLVMDGSLESLDHGDSNYLTISMIGWHVGLYTTSTMPSYRGKRQQLFTWKVNSYCRLLLHGRVHLSKTLMNTIRSVDAITEKWSNAEETVYNTEFMNISHVLERSTTQVYQVCTDFYLS